MQAWMFIAALVVAIVAQWFNSKPNVPAQFVKLGLAAIGPVLYLLVEQPTGPPGNPLFLEWLDKAWIWSLALPGMASLIGVAPGMATRVAGLLLGCAVMLTPATAIAQGQYSIWDVGKRTQVSVNVGGLVFFEQETGAESWRGVSAGGALTYSLHDRFAVFGVYDHGFPIDASTGHENILRASTNLKVYPPPGEASSTKLFIGGGAMLFERGATDGWRGYEGHVTVARVFRDGWALSGSYLHGRPLDVLDEKVNMAKVWLGHRLVGAK